MYKYQAAILINVYLYIQYKMSLSLCNWRMWRIAHCPLHRSLIQRGQSMLSSVFPFDREQGVIGTHCVHCKIVMLFAVHKLKHLIIMQHTLGCLFASTDAFVSIHFGTIFVHCPQKHIFVSDAKRDATLLQTISM